MPSTVGTQTPALPHGAYGPGLRTACKEPVKRRAKSIFPAINAFGLEVLHTPVCTGTENRLMENDSNVLVTG